MATTRTDPKLGLANGTKKGKHYEGLTRDQLIQAYRYMYISRRIDDREPCPRWTDPPGGVPLV